ncbi:DUF1924 domain-containing protein [Mariprofundus sp. EBB-1]|uniref:DUF1924 domain-containing protein n=1 Tax=Mariprofundus sp. EBB-1 TaxID=2650971 RepID=UPI000EF2571C|nr:DUF1924 domain-containing protein [Mariprofundus sp. EBB-1]RLL50431.1 DUF1924 domain-containing protein [Mariprofundus sp. EBB-1]
MYKMMLFAVMLLGTSAVQAGDGTVIDEVLAGYQAEGVGSFSAEHGKEMWIAKHEGPLGLDGNPSGEAFKIRRDDEPRSRSCQTCHGTDLSLPGKHWRTGKLINPMSPKAKPVEVDEDDGPRFSDKAKIEKWFLRNCKWTVGRECTGQEKGDLLSFLRNQ